MQHHLEITYALNSCTVNGSPCHSDNQQGGRDMDNFPIKSRFTQIYTHTHTPHCLAAAALGDPPTNATQSTRPAGIATPIGAPSINILTSGGILLPSKSPEEENCVTEWESPAPPAPPATWGGQIFFNGFGCCAACGRW